ncbi:MAG: 23S rRNA (adenine(2503)-C(2))-methyltransferase RlmN [candidate division WOR-3 bacterium]
MKQNIKAYSLTKLQELMEELGLEPYRAQQVFQWLWQKNSIDFEKMTNLSKILRKKLDDKFVIKNLLIVECLKSGDDAKKYVFELEDKKRIEGVYIPEANRRTICVSTQVGCPLRCKFCATGLYGFSRNLFAWEIANQIQLVQSDISTKPTNIVFMGMGEPLLNLSEVYNALEILSSSIGLGISQRHITVSTAGIIDGMRELLNSQFKVKLAISLNFADEELRKEMMPVAEKNPLKEVLKIAREYSLRKEMVTFEYVMIKGLNDRLIDARRLVKLLKDIPSKVNLIPLNEYPGLPFKSPEPEAINKFRDFLYNFRHTVTIRKSKGQEILAGCGQLAVRT